MVDAVNEARPQSTSPTKEQQHEPQQPEARSASTDPAPEDHQDFKDQKIQLASNNFESFVSRCFEGEACEFSEDPWKMYEDFKLAGNTKAIDSLISFMRKKLQDEKFRSQHKEQLLKVIDDFYSPQERQFQEAAYFNYLGDLQKSLDLYLDLEKKSASDPSLRVAPKLNIANTFYDLGKYREALPYYEAALGSLGSGSHANDTGRFIDARIAEIRAKR